MCDARLCALRVGNLPHSLDFECVVCPATVRHQHGRVDCEHALDIFALLPIAEVRGVSFQWLSSSSSRCRCTGTSRACLGWRRHIDPFEKPTRARCTREELFAFVLSFFLDRATHGCFATSTRRTRIGDKCDAGGLPVVLLATLVRANEVSECEDWAVDGLMLRCLSRTRLTVRPRCVVCWV